MTTPIPDFFNPERVDQIWRVPYQERAETAAIYTRENAIAPAQSDGLKLCLLAIDVQNTFCLPEGELYVGGRSGTGAVDDTRRLCEFVYRNLDVITEIVPTMDTHSAAQIFHPVFWVNEAGEHPAPMTVITDAEVAAGSWRVNPLIAQGLRYGHEGTMDAEALARFAAHYAKQLSRRNKYPLTIWPYHSMLGGIGHALVPAFEEACFFHSLVRNSPTRFEAKGDNPLTENYSVLSPEVLESDRGEAIGQKNKRLIEHLLTFDGIVVAGQAKSHCVAWTVSDLLSEIQSIDPALAKKVYLLEDCTSPVVVPGVVDFTDSANDTYKVFENSGMNIVHSVGSPRTWPLFGC